MTTLVDALRALGPMSGMIAACQRIEVQSQIALRALLGPAMVFRVDARTNIDQLAATDPRLRMFRAALAEERTFRAAPVQARMFQIAPAQARANLAAPVQQRMNRVAPFQERMFRATATEMAISWRSMIRVGGFARPIGGI